MIATFLALFFALACCQALLAVKLADWLSPASPTGHGSAGALRSEGAVSLA